MEEKKRFYGKYKGIVKDNNDTLQMGRLRAEVWDFDDKTKRILLGWAQACTPYAGKGVGLFLIPPIESGVWIEFEQGDPDYPIWTGCFWEDKREVPVKPYSPDIKILKTEFCTIKLDDSKTKGITIDTKISGQEMKIVMNEKGITITSSNQIEIDASRQTGLGKIHLKSGQVSINNDALEVT